MSLRHVQEAHRQRDRLAARRAREPPPVPAREDVLERRLDAGAEAEPPGEPLRHLAHRRERFAGPRRRRWRSRPRSSRRGPPGGRPSPTLALVEREDLRRVGRVDEVERGPVRDVVAEQLRRLVPVRRAAGRVEERDVVGVGELLRRTPRRARRGGRRARRCAARARAAARCRGRSRARGRRRPRRRGSAARLPRRHLIPLPLESPRCKRSYDDQLGLLTQLGLTGDSGLGSASSAAGSAGSPPRCRSCTRASTCRCTSRPRRSARSGRASRSARTPRGSCTALGLADELAGMGVRPLAWHQRRWDDGRTLLHTPLADEVVEAFGFPHYQTHRADLPGRADGRLPGRARARRPPPGRRSIDRRRPREPGFANGARARVRPAGRRRRHPLDRAPASCSARRARASPAVSPTAGSCRPSGSATSISR